MQAFSALIFLLISRFWHGSFVTSQIKCCSHSQQPLYSLSALAISGTLSLPWRFLSQMFHNCGRGEHVQTQAADGFVERWLCYSQPASTSIPQASFVVFGGHRLTSCYSTCFFIFFIFCAWMFAQMIRRMCHCQLGHCSTPHKPPLGSVPH